MTVWEPVIPLVDEPPRDIADAVPFAWRPYEPKVGDRVRVRLSGECQIPVIVGPVGSYGRERDEVGHFVCESGATGTVRACPNVTLLGIHCQYHDKYGHPIVVFFDERIRDERISLDAAHYAACELEPLES